jgi:hypothetical protein
MRVDMQDSARLRGRPLKSRTGLRIGVSKTVEVGGGVQNVLLAIASDSIQERAYQGKLTLLARHRPGECQARQTPKAVALISAGSLLIAIASFK